MLEFKRETLLVLMKIVERLFDDFCLNLPLVFNFLLVAWFGKVLVDIAGTIVLSLLHVPISIYITFSGLRPYGVLFQRYAFFRTSECRFGDTKPNPEKPKGRKA